MSPKHFFFTVLSVFFLNFPGVSQTTKVEKGRVEFPGYRIFEGAFDIDFTTQSIGVSEGKSFQIEEIVAFNYFDTDLNVERVFKTYEEINQDKNFYELVLEGKVEVWRKQYGGPLEKDMLQQSPLLSDYDQKFDYYYKAEESLVSMEEFNTTMLPEILKYHNKEIKKFILRYNLNLDYTTHQILLLKYYNSLYSPEIENLRLEKLLTIK
ncbi:hypothetical protein [Flexithrix dorotheae]|uniref:hypothetical protein n=1 Tax=Flexithrix dorotheae TaxID=70993 RepID=UPI0003744593|nr:hypothetical protein [Flexithrix dorotheae]